MCSVSVDCAVPNTCWVGQHIVTWISVEPSLVWFDAKADCLLTLLCADNECCNMIIL